ncbi:MAG: head GIN domain-containing protein [Candidatus Ozemobacteraceae bacterium]
MYRSHSSLGCLLAILLVSAIFSQGCSAGIPGSGTLKTDRRTPGEFKAITLSGAYTVIIEPGQADHAVTITTDDNLVDLIKTEMADGALKIFNESSINPTKGVEVKISLKELVAMDISGAGRIEAKNLSGPSLKLSISGAADFHGDGTVDAFEVKLSGAGNIKARDLKAKSVSITLSGAGNAEVFASESLTPKISGVGNIEYYGNPPKIEPSISGIGKLTKKD